MSPAEALARALAAVHDDLAVLERTNPKVEQQVYLIQQQIRVALARYGIHGGQS